MHLADRQGPTGRKVGGGRKEERGGRFLVIFIIRVIFTHLTIANRADPLPARAR